MHMSKGLCTLLLQLRMQAYGYALTGISNRYHPVMFRGTPPRAYLQRRPQRQGVIMNLRLPDGTARCSDHMDASSHQGVTSDPCLYCPTAPVFTPGSDVSECGQYEVGP